MDAAQLKGSTTAKDGFENEKYVVAKFNNWQSDRDAQQWLGIMGYDMSQIEYVKAVQLSGYKTDVQVQVQVTVKLHEAIDAQNLQVKLISNQTGFNQIDKRWVDKYAQIWDMPTEIADLLKLYTGETVHLRPQTKETRRLFATEFSDLEQQMILDWLRANQMLVVSDIIKGRGEFASEWMLVVQKYDDVDRWVLKPINQCLNHFGNGEIVISQRGTFKIGHITMQRKGGDGGRPTANMLQFKINPLELFTL